MLKIELIWRELLFRAIEKKKPDFSIKELADRFAMSTSVVSHALNPLREMRMVTIGKRSSRVIDSEKLLFFWATRRRVEKDIIYKTYDPQEVVQIESLMPPHVIPTAYSACRLYFDINPSDYDKVYYYASNAEDIIKRFPDSGVKKVNIHILKKDDFLGRYKAIPLAQVFADLWALPDWYAREFREALLTKIKTKIGL